LLAIGVAGAPVIASAEEFTVKVMQEKMSSPGLGFYISGIIDGLAYAAFRQEGEDKMRCINTWYYNTDGAAEQIFQVFDRFPDHAPSAVVGALVEKRCGG